MRAVYDSGTLPNFLSADLYKRFYIEPHSANRQMNMANRTEKRSMTKDEIGCDS